MAQVTKIFTKHIWCINDFSEDLLVLSRLLVQAAKKVDNLGELPEVLKEKIFSTRFTRVEIKKDDWGSPVILNETGTVRLSTHVGFFSEGQVALLKREKISQGVKIDALDTIGSVAANLATLTIKTPDEFHRAEIKNITPLPLVAGEFVDEPQLVYMVGAAIAVPTKDIDILASDDRWQVLKISQALSMSEDAVTSKVTALLDVLL